MGSSRANLLDLLGGDGGSQAAQKMSNTTSFGQLSADSNASGRSEEKPDRLLYISNQLPLRMKKATSPSPTALHSWDFEWDEDSLGYQAKSGIEQPQFQEIKVVYVGCLPSEVDPIEHDAVTQDLYSRYNCLPVFLGPELKEKYYSGFCKQILWPLMHYLLPMSVTSSGRFDKTLWQAYLAANKKFADRVMEIISPDDDYVWIHDYHLMLLPSFLRKRFNAVRIGFFLHCPFPSSEVFRTTPAREAILRALLNSDVIGFHTFDYARHFLSCCSRMLGLAYESRRGTLGIDYYGRTINIKICPTGINTNRLRQGLAQWPEAQWRKGELAAQFEGRTVFVGVDDTDIFKGIELKLAAYEMLLTIHPELKGKVSFVQVANPARSTAREVAELRAELDRISTRINGTYGENSLVLLERHVPLHERIALYAIADCAVVFATRDGMNLVPYEYVACREGPEETEAFGAPPRNSMLVVSEFVGCSPSLSGALRVNPWDIEASADALYKAISLPVQERVVRHEKHFRYVKEHNSAYWAAANFLELQRCCRSHATLRCYGLGFGLNFRVVALDPNFSKLQVERCAEMYHKSSKRLLLFDYEGTLVTSSPSFPTRPTLELQTALRTLAADPANTVYVVSGRVKSIMDEWFANLPEIGKVAEHGMYLKLPNADSWEEVVPAAAENLQWKELVVPILELYTESTDGSFIETRESAVVWHYCEADPDFGSTQAKELLDHLESVLANEPVEVVAGNLTVEVKPQGVSKGVAVHRIMRGLYGEIGFALCIGDDKSDEEMYFALQQSAEESKSPSRDGLFTCTVGQKPSKAPYYLNDSADVLELLQTLAGTATDGPKQSPHPPGTILSTAARTSMMSSDASPNPAA